MADWVAFMVGVVGIVFIGIIAYGMYRLLKSVGESFVRWSTHVQEDEKRKMGR